MTLGEERLLGGRYRLDRMLGRGGMGTVWHARDEVLGRSVAVKEVTTPPGLDAEARAVMHQRMLREARAAARLSHPGIVTVHDVVEENGVPWIVMEFVQARTLQDVIEEQGPLPSSRVGELGRQLLGALRAAHTAGILHRDVKPANVMLTEDRAILTDFGIAQMEGDVSLTQTGIVMGSPAYMSPERAQGLKPGPAADLWALGATLFAAAEGYAPFERPEVLSTLAAVMMEPVPPIQRAGTLAPVILGLLEKDPDIRLNAAAAAELLHRSDLDAPAAPQLTTTAQDRAQREFQPTAAIAEERQPVGEMFDSLYRPVSPSHPVRPEESTFRTTSIPPARHAPPAYEQPAYEQPVYEQPVSYEPPPPVYEPPPPPVRHPAPPPQPQPQPQPQWSGSGSGGQRRRDQGHRPGGRGLGFSMLVGSVAGVLAIIALVFVLRPQLLGFGGMETVSGSGFSIDVPRAWEKREADKSTFWDDPETSAYVQVDGRDWSDGGGVTAYKSLQNLRNLQGFQRIRWEKIEVDGQSAAEMEHLFQHGASGALWHGINRRLKVDGQAWAVFVAFPSEVWEDNERIAHDILDSFKP